MGRGITFKDASSGVVRFGAHKKLFVGGEGKMYDVLPLEVVATIHILEFLFIASSQNGSLVI